MRRLTLVTLFSVILAVNAHSALAAKRIALVIGVEKYSHLSHLNNPVRDAKAIAELFGKYGFRVVSVNDPNHAEFERALEAFGQLAQKAEEAVVYYAGHGMTALQDNKLANVLAPVDAIVNCETRTAERIITMQDVAEVLDGVPRTVLIFDACRSDPIRNCQSNALTKSLYGFQPARMDQSAVETTEAPDSVVDRGLRRIRADTADQSSSIVAYSTDLGFTASDGLPGLHSPYAKALLDELAQGPELPIYKVLVNTSSRVHESAKQRSWIVTKGAEPEMCLRGHNCESSDELKRKKALERSRVLFKTSEAQLSKGGTRDALVSALEAFRLTQSVQLPGNEAEKQLYQSLWRHREVRRRKLDISADSSMAWFDRRNGRINVRLDKNRVAVLDDQLSLLSTRKASARERRFFGRTEENADGIAYEGKQQRLAPAGRLIWSDNRRKLTIMFPGYEAYSITIDAAKIPFRPTQAFLSSDGNVENFRVVVRNRNKFIPKIAIIASGTSKSSRFDDAGNLHEKLHHSLDVVPIAPDKKHYLHSSGDVVVLSFGWQPSYFVNTKFPQNHIKLNDYLKNTTGYIGDIIYFPKSELFGYIGRGKSGEVRQPILVNSRSGVRVAILGGHPKTVQSLDASTDKKLVLSLSKGGDLRLWNLDPMADPRLVHRHNGTILGGVGRPAGDIHFGLYYDPSAPKTGELFIDRVTFRLRVNQKRGFEFWTSRVSPLAVAHSDSELFVFQKNQPDRPLFQKRLTNPLNFAFHQSGSNRIVLAYKGGAISILSLKGKVLFSGSIDPGHKVLAAKFEASDPQRLLLGTSAGLTRWNLNTGNSIELFRIPAGDKPVAMSIDGPACVKTGKSV